MGTRTAAEVGNGTAAGPRRRRLGEILVDAGVVTAEQLEDALAAQAGGGRRRRLGRTVVELELCTERDVANALATQLGLETVDLVAVGPQPDALARVPRKLAERHDALPLRLEDDVLVIAMADPTNVVALDDLKLAARVRGVRTEVAVGSQLADALRRAYGTDQAALDMVDSLADDVLAMSDDEEDLADDRAIDEQPVIRLANAVLADAVRTRASDVHVEPERSGVRVRYRIDGLLREVMRIPKNVGPALISRMKIMSNLDIAERRRPQDGRAMIRVEGHEVDLRVSTMPTMFGETVVMRLLRKGAERLDISELGLPHDVQEQFEMALGRPQGLVVITGPTGSGKTTTLYAGLTELADPIRNIVTLEDPIEYQLEGVNQTQVNPKIDVTFARGLRTVLRQDPDVVMVGEIRDRETAELAMEASFTGHLVLSTLHTNDAPSTIVRLQDLGVERFLIASSLIQVVAQRLVRMVCGDCVDTSVPDARTLRLLGLTRGDLEGVELVAGAGCQVCDHTGYLGRMGVYELLPVTAKMRELITAGASEPEIARLARSEGMRTLREDGLAKAFAGLTTLEEVARVTPAETLELERAVIDPDLVPTVVRRPAEPGIRRGEAALEVLPAADDEDGDLGQGLRPVGGLPTVLVVDDDDSVREMMGMLFIDDFATLEASNGAQALAMHERHRPDAIVLDQRLPDMLGIDVVRSIRERDGRRHVPIVMVTGASDTSLEVEALLAGVDDFVSKPFTSEVLMARVHSALSRKFAG